MQTIRWGILGCGRIAGKFAADLRLAEGGELRAVASRSVEKARAFTHDFPAKNIYGSYEELAADPEVDIIYIASPHSLHHNHTLLCLRHNKAVLCEKAFAINARQAREMITEARNRKIFLMEALWTKFLPHFQTVQYLINEGKIGTPRSLLVNFGFRPQSPVPDRIYDPSLGGGTLLDIGIYNVFMALSLLGKPDEIDAWMVPASTGVDDQCAITFRYRGGAMAQLYSSFAANLGTEADIAGDHGRIRLTHRFYEPSTTIEYFPHRQDSRETVPFFREEGWGYQFEIRHAQECLRQGLTESPVMSHANTLELIETLDEIRRKAGIRYDVDQE